MECPIIAYPSLQVEDQSPDTQTAIGIAGLSIAPNPSEHVQVPFSWEHMLSQRVYEGYISLSVDTTAQTQIQQEIVKWNDEINVWRNVPMSLYQYINFTKVYTFVLAGPDEIKGRIRFDIWDYPVYDADGTLQLTFDGTNLRNRHVYWDLTTSKSISFPINPCANVFTHARWRPVTDYSSGNIPYSVTVTPTGGTAVSSTVIPLTQLRSFKDNYVSASYSMSVDMPITWLAAAPGNVQILQFTHIQDFKPWGPKSYAESLTQRTNPTSIL